jgi:hypothetical protein
VRIGVALAMVVAAGAVVLLHPGLVTPRLGWPDGGGQGIDSGPGRLSFTVEVENQGWVPVTIVGIGRSRTGLSLQPPAPGLFPLTLQPGQSRRLSLDYRVSDCAERGRLSPVAIDVEGFAGRQTGYVDLRDNSAVPCQAD